MPASSGFTSRYFRFASLRPWVASVLWSCLPGVCIARAGDKPPAVDVLLPSLESRLLCGVNTTYLALRLCGKPVVYGELIDRFPGVENRGMTLTEIQTLLADNGVESQLSWQSERELLKAPGSLAIVLIPGGEIAHVVLKRASLGGGLEIFDPPRPLLRKRADHAQDVSMASLFIPTKEQAATSNQRRFLDWRNVGYISLAAGLLMLGWSRRKVNRASAHQCLILMSVVGILSGCRQSAEPSAHVIQSDFDAGAVLVPPEGLKVDHEFRPQHPSRRVAFSLLDST